MAQAQVNIQKERKGGKEVRFLDDQRFSLEKIADLSVGAQSQVPPQADRSTCRRKKLEEQDS